MTQFSHVASHETSFVPLIARLVAAGLSVIVTAIVSYAVIVGLTGGAVLLAG